jgi:hypothetical protein
VLELIPPPLHIAARAVECRPLFHERPITLYHRDDTDRRSVIAHWDRRGPDELLRVRSLDIGKRRHALADFDGARRHSPNCPNLVS